MPLSIELKVAQTLQLYKNLPINLLSRKIVEQIFTPEERDLLEQCREIGYGKFMVYCEGGKPVRTERALKSMKLGQKF